MRKRLMLQPLLGYRSTWPACLVLKALTLLWASYQMCTFCTVTAPGTSNCSAAKWARQINLSHVVPQPHCDTPIANTLIYTHSALPAVLVVFSTCFLLTYITGFLDFLLLIITYLKTCSLFISNIFLQWYFL